MHISAAGLRTLDSSAALVSGETNLGSTLKSNLSDNPIISGSHFGSFQKPLVDTCPGLETMIPRYDDARADSALAGPPKATREFVWPQFFHRAVLRKEIIMGKMRQLLTAAKLADETSGWER